MNRFKNRFIKRRFMQPITTEHPDPSPGVPPSIFNDVIGPVMRGPSSSHSAAALRIGTIARALMGNDITTVQVAFDRSGSLSFTHTSQGSDMGLAGGLLGFEAHDDRLLNVEAELEKAGIDVQYRVGDFDDRHPNTYRITLENSRENHALTALSTGGGMLEVIRIDGADLSIRGDMFTSLVYCRGDAQAVLDKCNAFDPPPLLKAGRQGAFVFIAMHEAPGKKAIDPITELAGVRYVRTIPPVLPIHRPRHFELPFQTPREMARLAGDTCNHLDDLALLYESRRGNIPEKDVLHRMLEIIQVLRSSLHEGLAGTEHEDRILGYQSGAYRQALTNGRLLDLGVMNRVVPYVTGLMEVKSALGVIVAAPTAGSCGCLPGALIGAADAMGKDDDAIARAMLAAGMIGAFIARISTFAAEVGGCQVECGAGSAMAAAGLTTLMGGTAEMALSAASMALQNSLGLICDPVAGRVEVPCLGKNVMAAANAVTCANMALADFDPVIPLTEVIQSLDRVGKSLPRELRCTALGGLAITPAAKAVEKNLSRRRQSMGTQGPGTAEE